MTLDDVLKYVNYITNKEQNGRTLSTTEYNTLLPIVSLKYFKKKYSIPEQFRVGMPFSKEAYEITQSIVDSIHQFKHVMGVDGALMNVDSYGKADIPSDYMHVSSAYWQSITNQVNCNIDVRYRTIEFLTDAEYTERLTSAIKFPSLRYPVATIRGNYIQFMPKNIQYVNFTYLRVPNTPYYDSYIDDTTDQEIYLPPGTNNPNTSAASQSVELEFEDTDIIDIASILLSMIGVNLRSGDLVQYSEKMKKEGV